MPDVNAELDAALLLLIDLHRTDALFVTPGTLELEARVSDILDRNKGRVQYLLQARGH